MEVEQAIVIDNFLHEQDFNTVRNIIMDESMQWRFASAVYPGDRELGKFHFVHSLFSDHQIQSDLFWDIMPPVLYGLGVLSLIDAKINLQTVSNQQEAKGFHVDMQGTGSHRTAVLCFSTCNGSTIFQDSGLKIQSVQNRIIDFPGNVFHAGVGQTDTVSRVVMNINYYPHDKRVFGPAVEPLSEAVGRLQ